MQRLKKRAEFVSVAKGQRANRRAFSLQARRRDANGAGPRIGYTVTKRTGNSVERNRIRRRLRELVRLSAAPLADPGCDYVLIGRRAALRMPFDEMLVELKSAFERVHRRMSGDSGSRSAGTVGNR